MNKRAVLIKKHFLLFVFASLALTGCTSRKVAVQRATDDGYALGNSDAIKRQYWLKQALEKKKAGGDQTTTKTYYYTFDGAAETEDGRKLVDQKITVPIKE